jgi:micrococcal nuclease
MRAGRRRRPVRFLVAFATMALAADLTIAACPSNGDTPARVAGVSERLEIELADGRLLRLAGLDTPDPNRGEPETARAARAFLTQFLGMGDVAVKALAPKPDRWNRTLADVFVAGPAPQPAQSAAAALLWAGFARVRPEVETRDCQSVRLAAEDAAREQGLGLWTDPYYAVLQAGDSEDLRARDGLFAIVEGKVIRVGVGRSRYYVDFGRRGAFTATIPKRQEKLFGRAGIDVTALAGATLRIRGALDNRFALRMEIMDPQQIERIAVNAGNKEAVPPR